MHTFRQTPVLPFVTIRVVRLMMDLLHPCGSPIIIIDMIKITASIQIPESDLSFSFIRSPGPGGQNVNKVATAVLLRFNINSTALNDKVRDRLKSIAGSQLTNNNDIIIKASRLRTQERNKQDAVQRLRELIQRAAIIPKKRKKTKPTKSSIEKRLTTKKQRGQTKSLRRLNRSDQY